MKLPLWAVAVATTLGLTLATGCSTDQRPGGLLGTPAEVAPPGLGDAPLRQIATHGETDPDDDTSSLSAFGVLETDDLVLRPPRPAPASRRGWPRPAWSPCSSAPAARCS